ncbi:AAA-like domain-containing protein [Butyrivibrio sp. ob235]|nr:AAA-like domain-containing protein [Butyrivibrio sp. ob235]
MLFPMFRKKKKRNLKVPARLSSDEKKKIKKVIDAAKKSDKVPHSVQESVTFERMFPSGICREEGDFYSKTIQFQDINYKLAEDEDKKIMFEQWCSFLNFFDSTVEFSLTFIEVSTDSTCFEKRIRIPLRQDLFNGTRDQYSGFLKTQFEKGNNGLTKTKYLTFGIHAASIREAKPRLNHIETDVLNNFKHIGVAAVSLNGWERLKVMHDIFHMGDEEKFMFDWKWCTDRGLGPKDFIVPSSLAFPKKKSFEMGDMFCAMSFLQITASEINDEMLADFLSMDSSQVLSIHMQSIDQNTAIKDVKHKITELDRNKIEEQKKAVRSGYDMDIIPSDLATYGRDAKELLRELQTQNERMFMITFLIMNTGKTERELETNVFQAKSIAQKHNCSLVRLDYQQEMGLMSSLPLARNHIKIQRGMTTSSSAIMIPFTTQELFQEGTDSLYYGLNKLTSNIIMADRKKLLNPNGLILGTPGAGKSFAAKREMANVMLATDDDIIVCDPEGEYAPLVESFNGQVIKISANSPHYINPMDINQNYSEDDNPIALKAEFILALCELVMGGRGGLLPVEVTVIDRCVHKIYNRYFENPDPEKMPVLEDLYNELLKQSEPEAKTVATALEIYVKGSLNVFNHRTNVDINNRFVCYDIKELGKQLKKVGMLIVQDAVWGRVTANRQTGKSTRYYMDEFHLLLRDPQTASYSVEIYKRFRKWGGIPTAITQNVKDLLSSPEIENILENSDFIYMLNQARGDRDILARKIGISEYQLKFVTQSGEGEGLLFFGNLILPFADHFPKNLELYKLLTTKPGEIAKYKEEKGA